MSKKKYSITLHSPGFYIPTATHLQINQTNVLSYVVSMMTCSLCMNVKFHPNLISLDSAHIPQYTMRLKDIRSLAFGLDFPKTVLFS